MFGKTLSFWQPATGSIYLHGSSAQTSSERWRIYQWHQPHPCFAGTSPNSWESAITPTELQDFRGLIGKLQYAATSTRPDLACRLSLLQAKVTCATVADLLNGNRLLNDAKKFSETEIKVKSLPPDRNRFLSFSDAAFATREKAHSQKGCLILATTDDIDQLQSSHVSPLIWFSKKINRVVASTLASETYALSGDSWISWVGHDCTGPGF